MSQSTDPGHFFQTTASIKDSERKLAKKGNKNGEPIKLPSKLLAVTGNLDGERSVYVAEAAGTVKCVDLEKREVTHTYAVSTSPVTCVAVNKESIFAGSWDKNVYSFALQTQAASTKKVFSGHTDFVKAVLVIPFSKSPLLVSASADATLIVWEIETRKKLHTLKGHARGVQALVLETVDKSHATIFSGDSSREIRRWHISAEKSFEISPTSSDTSSPADGPIEPLLAHETSIYGLTFDADGDLWTASADKTAKCLSRANKFQADTTLVHPDFVRAVAIYETGGLVVTACRDEHVRLWDKGSGKLVHTYEGHFEEVTGLVVDEQRAQAVSVSIDGTVRTWSLKGEDIKKAKEEAERAKSGEDAPDEAKKPGMLTAEEEAELAELMDDDDD